MKRLRKLFLAGLTAAVLLIGTAPAFAADPHGSRGFPDDPGEPTSASATPSAQSFPDDPGEPTSAFATPSAQSFPDDPGEPTP